MSLPATRQPTQSEIQSLAAQFARFLETEAVGALPTLHQAQQAWYEYLGARSENTRSTYKGQIYWLNVFLARRGVDVFEDTAEAHDAGDVHRQRSGVLSLPDP